VKLSVMRFSPGSVTSPAYVQNSPQHSVLIFLIGTWHLDVLIILIGTWHLDVLIILIGTWLLENTISIIPYQI
jgi:hypothetical protein